MHRAPEVYVNLAVDGAIVLAWLGLSLVCLRRSYDSGWAWLGRIGGFLAFVGSGASFAARFQIVILEHHSLALQLAKPHVGTVLHVVLMAGILTVAAGFVTERA